MSLINKLFNYWGYFATDEFKKLLDGETNYYYDERANNDSVPLRMDGSYYPDFPVIFLRIWQSELVKLQDELKHKNKAALQSVKNEQKKTTDLLDQFGSFYHGYRQYLDNIRNPFPLFDGNIIIDNADYKSIMDQFKKLSDLIRDFTKVLNLFKRRIYLVWHYPNMKMFLSCY
mgnify:CR=1 FL=1